MANDDDSDLRIANFSSGEPESNRALTVEIDHSLIQSVDDLRGGKITHVTANLVRAYTAAIELYRASGDEAHLQVARDAEKSLHILLSRLRLKQAAEMDGASD